jgi:hypothetical protein
VPLRLLFLAALAAVGAGVLWSVLPVDTRAGNIEITTAKNTDADIVLDAEHGTCPMIVVFLIVSAPDHGTLRGTTSGDLLDDGGLLDDPGDRRCDTLEGEHGWVGFVTYQPDPDFTGSDEFKFRDCHLESGGPEDCDGDGRFDDHFGGGVNTATIFVGDPDGAPTPTPIGTLPAAEARFEANASNDLTLTSSMTDIPGLSRSLAAGNWKIEACLLFAEQGSGDEGQSAAFRLVQGSAAENGAGVIRLYEGEFQTVCFNWLIDISNTTTVKVQARKAGGTGQSAVLSSNETSRMIGTEEP